MKKSLISLIAFIFFYLNIYGQTYKITFDFNTNEYVLYDENNKPVTKISSNPDKKPIRLSVEIQNINRYLYDIEVSIEDYKYHSEAPQTLISLLNIDGSAMSGNLFTFINDANKKLEYGIAPFNTNVNSRLINILNQIYKYENDAKNIQLTILDLTTKNKIDSNLVFKNNSDDLLINLNMLLNKNKEINDSLLLLKLEANTTKDSSIIYFLNTISITSKTDFIKYYEQAYIFLKNFSKKSYIYETPFMEIEGYEVEIKINISPRTNLDTNKTKNIILEKKDITLRYPITRLFQISFSSGLFSTINISKHTNNKYSIFSNFKNFDYVVETFHENKAYNHKDTVSYALKRNDQNINSGGFSAFMHGSWRLSKQFALGGTIGAGISIQKNPSPYYFLGTSLLFGNHQRFNINFGLAFSHVRRLNANLYENKRYYIDEPKIEYRHILKGGCYISLSYNIITIRTLNKPKTKKESE